MRSIEVRGWRHLRSGGEPRGKPVRFEARQQRADVVGLLVAERVLLHPDGDLNLAAPNLAGNRRAQSLHDGFGQATEHRGGRVHGERIRERAQPKPERMGTPGRRPRQGEDDSEADAARKVEGPALEAPEPHWAEVEDHEATDDTQAAGCG